MGGRRVSIFLPSLAGGGAERAITAVANGLVARGHEVYLVLASARGPYLDLVGTGVRVVDLRTPSMALALPRLARHLHAVQPHALLAAMTHANVAAALAHRLAGSRARLVLSERAHLSSVFGEYGGWRMRATRALMRFTYPHADQVVAVSASVAADLPNHVRMDLARIITIHNPVVGDELYELAGRPPAHPWFRDALPVVLAAGRLIPQKDFATLLRAFAQVRAAVPARLIVLGEGPLLAELRALAAQLGIARDVDFPGFDPNPFAAMRAARLFVLPSRYEGLPGVLIQAMACGTSVVSTDCPGGSREILEGGRWGALVPVGDDVAMAAAMAAALQDPAPTDVRTRARDFSVAAAVDRYALCLGL